VCGARAHPLRLLRSGTVELLEGEPSAEISDAVRATVEEVRQRFGPDEPIVRLHKLGRKLYVEVDFVVEPGEWDVSEEDGIRRAVADGLAPVGLDCGPTWSSRRTGRWWVE